MVKRVGIVGCGLIGHKRAQALTPHQLVAVADVNPQRARALADKFPGCETVHDWRELVAWPDLDVVVVSTTNDVLAAITHEAVRHGKHVLVEKPAARNSIELRSILSTARSKNACIKVGFNHRFHPAFQKARQLVDAGAIGPMMYVRARYGHGGRVGYEREWRANPEIAGGGELLDQGVHLIDLARWFLGEFTEVRGHVGTYFWNMPVEDNGFLMLKTMTGTMAWMHASCTEWKNTFSFEIFGRDGKLQIDGLGGSYGVERLSFYRMLPQMGPPETTIWEYPGADMSWIDEFRHFVDCIDNGDKPLGGLEDAIAALDVVQCVYQQSIARAA